MEKKTHSELDVMMMHHGWSPVDVDELAAQVERNRAAFVFIRAILARIVNAGAAQLKQRSVDSADRPV